MNGLGDGIEQILIESLIDGGWKEGRTGGFIPKSYIWKAFKTTYSPVPYVVKISYLYPEANLRIEHVNSAMAITFPTLGEAITAANAIIAGRGVK